MKLLAAELKLGFGGQIPRNEQCCLLECLMVDIQIAALQLVFHANKKNTKRKREKTKHTYVSSTAQTKKGENIKVLNTVY